MASKKKNSVQPSEKIKDTEVITEEIAVIGEPETKEIEKPAPASESKPKSKPKHKYSVGSIVYVSKDADADLNGFKLFPQYKKYTYTVEAYDENTGVYTLRRLNLSLSLPERLILAPDERAHDSLNRKQF